MMNKVRITHIMWSRPQRIEIALHKLVPGDNIIDVTVKEKGKRKFQPFILNRENANNIYGVEEVQKGKFNGFVIPTFDITEGKFKNA